MEQLHGMDGRIFVSSWFKVRFDGLYHLCLLSVRPKSIIIGIAQIRVLPNDLFISEKCLCLISIPLLNPFFISFRTFSCVPYAVVAGYIQFVIRL